MLDPKPVQIPNVKSPIKPDPKIIACYEGNNIQVLTDDYGHIAGVRLLPDDIYTCYLRGSVWSQDAKIASQSGGIQPATSCRPSACAFNNRVFLLYKSSRDGSIWQSIYDGVTWSGDLKLNDLAGGTFDTDASPCVVAYNETLYLFYKQSGSADLMFSILNGSAWVPAQKVGFAAGGAAQTDYAVSAVVFGPILYLAYKENGSKQVRVIEYNGSSWSKMSSLDSLGPWSDAAPALAVCGEVMYLAYKGYGDARLYLATCQAIAPRNQTYEWSGNRQFRDLPGGIDPMSDQAPALVSYNGGLSMLYLGRGGYQFYYSWMDAGGVWHGDELVSGIDPKSNYGPCLCPAPSATQLNLNWLSSIGDDKKICDINLPGTHDSAAINSYFTTFYACHTRSITGQLQSGIRLLDVRLKVKGTKPNYEFQTCHGNLSAWPWRSVNEYQTFASLVAECKDFLRSSSSEFIAMSLRVDDWNGFTDRTDVLAALKRILDQDSSFLRTANMPTLKEVRGKIYLLNRIDTTLSFGVPFPLADNTVGQTIDPSLNLRNFSIYAQDKYEKLSATDPQGDKYALFWGAVLKCAPNKLTINFASATQTRALPAGLSIFGVYINELIVANFMKLSKPARPTYWGWCLFDYADRGIDDPYHGYITCIDLLIASNSDYYGY